MINRKYIDSIRVHFPASHVSLPECMLVSGRIIGKYTLHPIWVLWEMVFRIANQQLKHHMTTNVIPKAEQSQTKSVTLKMKT